MIGKDAESLDEVIQRVGENYGPGSHLNSDRLCADLHASDSVSSRVKELVAELHRTCAARMGANTKTALLIAATLARAACRHCAVGQSEDFISRLNDAAKAIVCYLKSRAVEVEGGKEVAQVACTAAGGSKEIATAVTNAVQTAGADGVVHIVEDQGGTGGVESSVTFFSQPASAFDVLEDGRQVLLVNPLILISQDPLESVQLEQAIAICRQHKRSLLCMAPTISSASLASANEQIVLIPLDVDRLIDIATLTSATMLEGSDSLDRNVFGSAEEVRSYGKYLLIFEGDGDVQAVADQVDLLYETMAESDGIEVQEGLQTRIASLSAPLVELQIRGKNNDCRDASLYQTSAALYAARQAISHGVLPGGGTAYMQGVRYILDNEELKSGIFQCWAKALTSPLRALYQGSDEGFAVLVDKLASNEDLAFDAEAQLLVSCRHKQAPLDPVDHVAVCVQTASEVVARFLESCDG